MSNTNKSFPKGIYIDTKNFDTWSKDVLSFKVEDAIKYLQEKANAKGYVNIDIKESREGKKYLELNTFQPKPVEASNDDFDDDIADIF